jgi:hypothetical protein
MVHRQEWDVGGKWLSRLVFFMFWNRYAPKCAPSVADSDLISLQVLVKRFA